MVGLYKIRIEQIPLPCEDFPTCPHSCKLEISGEFRKNR